MKKFKGLKRVLVLMLSIIMVINTMIPAMAQTTESADVTSYINDLILYYRDYQDAAQTDIDRTLAEMAEVDAGQAEAWSQIMDYWSYVNSDMVVNTEVAPDGLPDDNSMAIVILGYALNDDGTMKDELVGRLQVGLNTANKYPNAYVVVTGGGTAANNPDVTEGGLMGQWLLDQGLDESRLIIENKAPNTVGNAENTYKILNEQYPQVKSLVMVTSDYHVPRGCILFYSKCLLAAYESGGEVLEMVSNAGYISGHEGYETIALQATGVASVAGISLSGSVELSQLSSLTITQNTPYVTGNELDITVEASYNTGFTRDVTDLVTVTGFDATQDANQEITVSYTENDTTIEGTFALTETRKKVVVTTHLEELIATAEGKDSTAYTAASFAGLADAIQAAKDTLNKDGLTVEEVNEAYNALRSAVNKLRPRANVAYYMNVTASSNQTAASKITDGSTSTFWTALEDGVNVPIEDSEVVVELDGVYDLEEIVVRPYYDVAGSYYHYDVLVSEDNENWTLVAQYRDTDGGSTSGNSHPVDMDVNVKYIKVKGIDAYVPDSEDINNFQLAEIYAYGEEVYNLVLGKDILSSGSDQSAASSAGALDYTAVDGDRTTYWDAGKYASKPWIIVDLDGTYELDSVNVINYWKGNNRYYNFEVYTSMDGEYFTLVGGKTTTDKETIFGNTVDLSDTTVYATHIKVVGTYNSKNSAFHINELRAYGEPVEKGIALAYEERKVLQNIVDEYSEKYAAEDYTEETFAPYEAALNEAIAVLADENSAYEDLKACKEALAACAEALEFRKDDTKVDGTLRVATLNLAAYNKPDTALMKEALLERYCVDMVGMQEVDKNTTRNPYDVLGSFEDDFYQYSSFKQNIPYQGGSYGTGILSSLEILDTDGGEYVQIENEEIRGWQKIVFEYDGKEIALYNTHLSTKSYANGSNMAEIIAVMDADPIEYKILTADFNATKENMYPFLVNYDMVNGKGGEWFGTSGGSEGLWFEGQFVQNAGGIDNIIHTRNMEVTNISVVDTGDMTDHKMVYADFKFLDESYVSMEYINIVLEEAAIRNREGIYTEETFAPFTAAYEHALTMNPETSTQEEVNNAAFELIEAMEGLVRIVPNVALGKTVLGEETEADYPLANVTDGDVYTYWEGNGTPNEVVIDLGDLYEISEMRVVPRTGNRIYYYDVYYSVDGENYSLVAQKTENEYETYRGQMYLFDEVQTARFVKVVMTYHSGSEDVHLGEVEIFGTVAESVDTYKEALKEMIDSYTALDYSAYVTATTALLKAELIEAQAVYENADATIEEVEAAQAELLAAYEAMELLPDKTDLAALIEANKDTDLTGYSTHSAEQFTEKLAQAIAVYEEPQATKADVDQAIAELNIAIEDLMDEFSIARGLTAEVSHNEADAANLNDNKVTNYWEATDAAVNEAEFIIDLDGLYDLEKFTMRSDYSDAGLYYHYDILVSEDKENWTTVVAYRGDAAATEEGTAHLVEDIEARYVKVKGVAAYENGAVADTTFRVREFYVFGEEIGNLALYKPVSSSTYQSPYYDRKAVNGSRYDYWDGYKYSARPWFIVDLEGLYKIDSINLITVFTSERYYNYELYASTDGVNYTLIGGKDSTDLETIYGNTHTFEEDVYATHIKVVGTKNSLKSTFHINEFRVYGEEVREKEELAIVTQPVDVTVEKGENATVSVEATGEGLTYTWYYMKAGGHKYYVSGVGEGNTYSIPMYAYRDGYTVYCVITDENGESVETNKVTLSMKKPSIVITKQPEDASAAKGEDVTVTVEAEGEGLTYTWYYKKANGGKFYKSGLAVDNTYTTTMYSYRDGYQVYCVITNAAGETVQSNTVTLTMVE